MRMARRIAAFAGQTGLDYWRALGGDGGLKNVLPNLPAALSDLRAFVSSARELAGVVEEADSRMKPLNSPLTSDEQSRLRFGKRWGPQGPFFKFGERWGRGLSLYYEVLPTELKSRVLHVLRSAHVFECKTASSLAAILKSLTGLAKKHGDLLFPGFWKELVNLETLGGYLDAPEVEDFIDELREWASGDVVHETLTDEGVMSEETFLDDLEEGMEQFINSAPNVQRANRKAMTIDEWTRYPGNWARAGSSKHKEAVWYRTDDGREMKAKKTKWRTALALPVAAVRQILKETNPSKLTQKNAAIGKRETGKVRAVVNSDDETYLRMAYISHWLETALAGHPDSTLFMSQQQMADMWQRFAHDTQDQSVKIPLDQSHFDWQQNKRMIDRFIRVVGRFISSAADRRVKDDLLFVLAQVKYALVDSVGDLVVKRKNGEAVHIPVEKGVMSGWRWTALMDTVFNWGELHAAKKLLRRAGFPEPIIEATAQGDDDRVRARNYGCAAGVAEAYRMMNFDVNPSKFFVDTARDEYLRRVAQPGLVAGYLARGITAILWRNPISMDPPAGILRMREAVKSWNTLLGRGGDREVCTRLMMEDLCGGSGLPKAVVEQVLATPAAMGGIGWYADAHGAWVDYSPGMVAQKGRIIEASVRGLDQEFEDWQAVGARFTKSEAIQSLKDNLELSEAKREVTPGSVRDTERLDCFSWKPGLASGGVPLQARMRDDLPPTLGSFALEDAVRRKNWDWIRNVWLDPALRDISNQIEKRGSRRIWIDWLTGKLPWHLPVVEGWSDLKPSLLYDSLARNAWSRVVAMPWFDYLSVKRAALSAEWTLRDHLASAATRVAD